MGDKSLRAKAFRKVRGATPIPTSESEVNFVSE